MFLCIVYIFLFIIYSYFDLVYFVSSKFYCPLFYFYISLNLLIITFCQSLVKHFELHLITLKGAVSIKLDWLMNDVFLQLSVVDSSRDQGLYGLYRELENAKALLSKLDEAVHRWEERNHQSSSVLLSPLESDSRVMCFIFPRYPNQELEISRNTWRATVQEVEKKISSAEVRDSISKVTAARVEDLHRSFIMKKLSIIILSKTRLCLFNRRSIRSRWIKWRTDEESVSCFLSTSTTSPNLQLHQ